MHKLQGSVSSSFFPSKVSFLPCFVFPAWIAPFCSVLGWFVLLLFCSVIFDVFAAILQDLQEVAVARVVSQEDAQHLGRLLTAHARGRHTLNGIMFSWHKAFRLDMKANNLVSERTLLVACVRDVMQCEKILGVISGREGNVIQIRALAPPSREPQEVKRGQEKDQEKGKSSVHHG